MRWWLGALLLITGSGLVRGQSPSAGYLGSGANQPFNEKSLFPGTSGGPSSGPDELPQTLIPDGSLPPPPPPKRLAGGFEIGLNGSQGNANVTNVRLGLNTDWRPDRHQVHADLLYTLSRQDGLTNQNQALLNARDEIIFPNTKWRAFTAAQVEYDVFRAYDFRAGSYAGATYPWIKTDATSLKTRFGGGAVRELDLRHRGAPDRWVPEAILGMDFNHRFTDRQGFVSSVDVYPNLSQIGQYRVRSRLGYEIVVAPKHGMVLRLGVQERYDSSPGGAKRNDLNFFSTLLFKF